MSVDLMQIIHHSLNKEDLLDRLEREGLAIVERVDPSYAEDALNVNASYELQYGNFGGTPERELDSRSTYKSLVKDGYGIFQEIK